MRRKEREIGDFSELMEIVEACKVCRIAMTDQDGLYIVPMNFGCHCRDGRLTLFFHSAKEGRKIDALRANPNVCVEMDTGHQLKEAQSPCGHSFAFRSLVGWGKARFLTDIEEKKAALSALMKHQTGRDFHFTDAMTEGVAVFQVSLDTITGKGNF